MHLRPGSPFRTGALQLMLQISEALAHAHEQGVLHGDLKPSNIVMSIAGMPMLVDFNLSQSCESNNLVTGGTLPYMAPEQIRSMLLGPDRSDRVDQRSDIFSLGVILFELLTGRLPFEASQPETEPFAAAGRMLDAQSDGVASLRPLMRDLDPGLTDLLASCLSLDAQDRPQDIRRVSEEIRRYLSWTHRFRRALRRHRPLVATLAVMAGMTVAGLGMWSSQRPSVRDRLFRRGVEAFHRQDYAAAIESLGDAIAADEQFADAYLARSLPCNALNSISSMVGSTSRFRILLSALRYGSGSEALNSKAYCLIRKNEYPMAARDLEELIYSWRSLR